MPILYLVRHGRAAAAWDADSDPGLDVQGREQAQAVAHALAPQGPLDLIVSPMARTRETAEPLARRWQLDPRIDARVTEIPSPMDDLAARGAWLKEIAGRSWPELDASLQHWRTELLAALIGVRQDAVVVTHFMAINAAVGHAVGDHRVVHFRPAYFSVTILRNDGSRLSVVQLGAESETRVL
jgi:broad specificity phosphatase PhoE